MVSLGEVNEDLILGRIGSGVGEVVVVESVGGTGEVEFVECVV